MKKRFDEVKDFCDGILPFNALKPQFQDAILGKVSLALAENFKMDSNIKAYQASPKYKFDEVIFNERMSKEHLPDNAQPYFKEIFTSEMDYLNALELLNEKTQSIILKACDELALVCPDLFKKCSKRKLG